MIGPREACRGNRSVKSTNTKPMTRLPVDVDPEGAPGKVPSLRGQNASHCVPRERSHDTSTADDSEDRALRTAVPMWISSRGGGLVRDGSGSTGSRAWVLLSGLPPALLKLALPPRVVPALLCGQGRSHQPFGAYRRAPSPVVDPIPVCSNAHINRKLRFPRKLNGKRPSALNDGRRDG